MWQDKSQVFRYDTHNVYKWHVPLEKDKGLWSGGLVDVELSQGVTLYKPYEVMCMQDPENVPFHWQMNLEEYTPFTDFKV